ncbi:MAG: hypothetical protein Q9160_000446 [Pyrenula sp. 1 TL-2023]
MPNSRIFRVRGLPQRLSGLQLQIIIQNNLSDEERLSIEVTVDLIPSCYHGDEIREALVDLTRVPRFLQGLVENPQDDVQVDAEGADLTFDCHFNGFTQLYPIAEGQQATTDVIVVSGLDGHAFGSWRSKKGLRRIWLRDFLSKDLPSCRTMIYGYNSKLGSRGISTILDFGRGFLEEIQQIRGTPKLRERPLIFIGHSFGGIIIAHCLIKSIQASHEHSPLIASLYPATYGLLLFGVPHKGLIIDDIEKMLAEEKAHPRHNVLRQIQQCLDTLASQLIDLKNLLRDRKVTSFYETQQTRSLQFHQKDQTWKRTGNFITVVDPEASMLHLPDHMEEKVPLDVDHSSIVKFSSKEVVGYKSTMRRLKEFERVQGCTNHRGGTEKDFQNLLPSGTEYRSQKDQNPKRVPGTCLWTLENPKYIAWRDDHTKKLCWISADPGCGKCVLARCIIYEDLPGTLRDFSSTSILYYFFKDSSPEQRSLVRAVQTVLHQLLDSKAQLRSDTSLRSEVGKAVKSASFTELWSLFMAAATSPSAGNVICIFDAFDECDEREQSVLAEKLEKYCLNGRRRSLKFLITSRPYMEIRYGFSQIIREESSIELAGSDESDSIKREIDLVIRSRVEDVARRTKLPQKARKHLQDRLLAMEQRTYLWLRLVFELIPKTWPGTVGEMNDLIDDLPDGITKAYETLLKKTPRPAYARKALHLVLAARRPLKVDEMDAALSITEDVSTSEELELQGSSRLKYTLPSLCVLTVSIVQSKVYFIHQPVKEFLIGDRVVSSTAWRRTFNLEQSEEIIRDVCLRSIDISKASPDRANFLDGLLPEYMRIMRANSYCQEFVLLSYSAVYWADHCRDSENSKITETLGRLVYTSQRFPVRYAYTCLLEKYGESVTPLQAASVGGHLVIVWMLLELGLNVNAKAGKLGTALKAAILFGEKKAAKLLLERGADINLRDDYDERTALCEASSRGQKDVVAFCLDREANVDLQDIKGQSPLSEAVRLKNKDIIHLMLERGANVDLRDCEGQTALFMTVIQQNVDIV